MRAVGAIVFAISSSWLFVQPAAAEKRVALVIGNSSYQHVAPLSNPANDSEAMAATLKGAAFDVVELKRDLKAAEMRRALRDFSDQVRDADVAVVYFAGHGIEIDGINYVIPTDALLERDIDAFDEAVPLDRILTVIEPARQLRLVILDACRDSPFIKPMKRTSGSRSIGRGLARVEPGSPNTLIAFAARAGSTASDGDSRNSPFTAALVKHLVKPGLDLRKAFGFTRDDVLKATGNRQEPFVYGSLGGEDVVLVPATPSAGPAAGPADAGANVRRDYEFAERVGTREAWDFFLSVYHEGFYAKLAQAQRNKLAAEEARVAATENARLAAEQQSRLAAEGAKAGEQAKAASQAKVAEAARVAAEQTKAIEEAKVSEAARLATDDAKPEGIKINEEKGPERLAARTEEAAPKQQAPISADLPRLLQTELRRVGCHTGAIDGIWNASAQKSLALFNKNAGSTLDAKVASLDALDIVRSKTERICPLVCERGYKADTDGCSKLTCKPGFEIGDNNSCERVAPKRPSAAGTATRQRHQAATARRPSGGRCFSFNGKSYCE